VGDGDRDDSGQAAHGATDQVRPGRDPPDGGRGLGGAPATGGLTLKLNPTAGGDLILDVTHGVSPKRPAQATAHERDRLMGA
jgi:hypothetical protein